MQATSTPTLAQPKPNALGALAAAAILAVAIGAGGYIGSNIAQSADVAPAAGLDYGSHALSLQRNGETGALTPAQRALTDQRQGEIGAAAAVAPVVAGPVFGDGRLIWLGTSPGTTGKISDDQMAQFNAIGLSKPAANEVEKVGRAHR